MPKDYRDSARSLGELGFLYCLNLALERLGAMLPDETLRLETRQFTAINRWLILGMIHGTRQHREERNGTGQMTGVTDIRRTDVIPRFASHQHIIVATDTKSDHLVVIHRRGGNRCKPGWKFFMAAVAVVAGI